MDLFQLIGSGFCEVQDKATKLPRTKEETESKYNRKSVNESGIQEVSEASMKIWNKRQRSKKNQNVDEI